MRERLGTMQWSRDCISNSSRDAPQHKYNETLLNSMQLFTSAGGNNWAWCFIIEEKKRGAWSLSIYQQQTRDILLLPRTATFHDFSWMWRIDHFSEFPINCSFYIFINVVMFNKECFKFGALMNWFTIWICLRCSVIPQAFSGTAVQLCYAQAHILKISKLKVKY